MQAERDLPGTLDPSDAGAHWPGKLVQVVVLAILTVAPWGFGSVEPWARLVLFAGIAVALAIGLPQLVRRPRANLALPLAAIPLVLGLLLGVGQTVALPDNVLSVLAPGASRWRDMVSPASPEVLTGDEPSVARLPEPTVSLYPSATRSRLFELTLYLAAFLLGFQYFRRRQAQIWLCGVATALGGVIALFGIIQWVSGTHRIYWMVELSQGGRPFGPFVNTNNAGGFLNLCLAASLGLLLYLFPPRRQGRGPRGQTGMSPRAANRLVVRWIGPLGDLTAIRLGLFATTGLIVAAVLCTLSRGAFLAMIGGAAVVLVATMAMRRSRGAAVLACLGVSAVLLIAWAGMSETVQKRLATLFPAPETTPHPLFPHWRDSLTAVPDVWPVGSGLGTYRFLYRAYEQQLPTIPVFYHAENLYVETLLETGVIGLGLVLAAWATISVAAWKVTRTAGCEHASPLAFGGIFLVASQAIHSMADFGLFIPANALWFAVLCGSLVGRAVLVRRLSRGLAPGSNGLGFAGILLPLAAAGLLVLTLLGAQDVAGSIGPANALRAWRLDSSTTVAEAAQQIDATIARLIEGLPGAWTDAEVHQTLADFYMARYRIETENALRSPEDAEPTDLPAPGSVTDPILLSATLLHLPDAEREEARRNLEADPAVQRNLLPALRHSLLAREFCPLLPRVEMHLAELSFLMRSGDSDAAYLDRARRLAPSDAGVWFGAGLLDWHARRPEAAYRSWRRALELSGTFLVPILDRCAASLSPAAIPTQLLPDRPAILLEAAEHLYPGEESATERQPFLARALDLLTSQSEPLSGDELWVKASLHRQLGDREAALEDYRAALAQQPRQVECRYEFAACLFEQGQLQQALWQVDVVLDQSPKHKKARELAQQVRRAMAEGGNRRDGTQRHRPSSR